MEHLVAKLKRPILEQARGPAPHGGIPNVQRPRARCGRPHQLRQGLAGLEGPREWRSPLRDRLCRLIIQDRAGEVAPVSTDLREHGYTLATRAVEEHDEIGVRLMQEVERHLEVSERVTRVRTNA